MRHPNEPHVVEADPTGHHGRDDEKLRLHRIIAGFLREDATEPLRVARENLRRWKASMGTQPYLEEWEALLTSKTPQELASLIEMDTEEGRRLRQSSPFAGVVAGATREAIYNPAR